MFGLGFHGFLLLIAFQLYLLENRRFQIRVSKQNKQYCNLLIKEIKGMRKNNRNSPTPTKSPARSAKKPRTTPSPHKQLESEAYFCHFKNAMYMGGIKSFQKHGKGIILHDRGASLLTSYHHDMRHGHNAVFMENCVMSIEYIKNKVSECVIRVPQYLSMLRYNKQGHLDGKCILLDYQTRAIYYVMFRKNAMIQKTLQKQYSIINRVFDLDNLQFLLGITHAKVLRYELEQTDHIQSQRTNHKLNVGFYKNGLLNGLGFTLFTQDTNPQNKKSDLFFIKLAERGFFSNSQLTGMGEKWFKNGNQYIGDFKSDIFQGRGLLKNTLKNNWVYGSFDQGNLVDLIDYNNEGDTRKLDKIIESMHERKSSWINKDIELEDPNYFIKEIDKILENNPKNPVKTLQERKQEVLRKIQDNFICEPQGQDPMSSPRNNIYDDYHNNKNNHYYDSPPKDTADFDVNVYAQRFLHSHSPNPKADSPPISSSPQHQSPQTKHEYFSDQIRILPSKNNSSPQQVSPKRRKFKYMGAQEGQSSYPINTNNTNTNRNVGLKLYEVQTTKQSSSRSPIGAYPRENYAQHRLDTAINKNKAGIFRNHQYNSPSRSKYSKVSAIQNQPQANLDSKRLIGRSRLFKYMGKQDQEDPPHFTYHPIS